MKKSRKKAINILEGIAGYMAEKGLGDEDMFDCLGGNVTWYDLEDMIVNIIEGKE